MTKQNNALRLADELCEAIAEYPEPTALEAQAAAELRRLHAYCQELESQVILDCMTHVQNPAEIEHVAGDVSKNGAGLNMSTQHTRITELAQRFDAADIATAAAQGFRDGVASVSAGSEPVPNNRRSLEAVFRGLSDRAYCNYIEQMRRDACLGWEHKAAHGKFGEAELKGHTIAGEMLGRHKAFAEAANALRGSDAPLTYPSPQEGMVGGWMPIETAPKYTEHGIRQHLLLGYAPDEIHEDGFVSQGYWMEPEEDAPDNMGHDGGWVDVHFDFFSCGRSFGAEAYRSTGTQPTHWQPLPAAPGPADGESNE